MIDAVDTTEPTFRSASLAERYFSLALVVATACAVVAISPIAKLALLPSETFIAAAFSGTIVMMLVSALISYNWYVATGSAPYAMYATVYGATAAYVIAYVVTFPNVAPPGTLLANATETSAYYWICYHLAFFTLLGAALASQSFFDRRERRGEPSREIVRRYVAVVAVGTAVAILTIGALSARLPPIVRGGSYAAVFDGPLRIIMFAGIATVAVGLIGLTRLRRRIDLWIAVTLAAGIGELTLSLVLTSERYTVAWYGSKLLGSASLATLFVAQFGQIATVLEALARDRRSLTTSAGRDALTGLSNRRSFDEQLAALWRSSRESGRPLALVIVDIDFFKQYNDRYGHPSGDDALRIVARQLASAARRPSDVCARIGGEEFALILPATDAAGAYLLAETIRSTLEERRIPHALGVAGRLTASFGVASSSDRGVEGLRQIHEQADEALYEAKRSGRNRVARVRP